MVEKSNRRNSYGVKASSELYRTIKGQHYICWLSFPTPEQTARLKAAGIRCARRGVELFIAAADAEKAIGVDPGA